MRSKCCQESDEACSENHLVSVRSASVFVTEKWLGDNSAKAQVCIINQIKISCRKTNILFIRCNRSSQDVSFASLPAPPFDFSIWMTFVDHAATRRNCNTWKLNRIGINQISLFKLSKRKSHILGGWSVLRELLAVLRQARFVTLLSITWARCRIGKDRAMV